MNKNYDKEEIIITHEENIHVNNSSSSPTAQPTSPSSPPPTSTHHSEVSINLYSIPFPSAPPKSVKTTTTVSTTKSSTNNGRRKINNRILNVGSSSAQQSSPQVDSETFTTPSEDVPTPTYINMLSINLLVHIFSFLCEQLEERSDSETAEEVSDVEEEEDEILNEDTRSSLETVRNTILNASHSVEEIALADQPSSPHLVTPKKKKEKRASGNYYTEFGIEEDEELTTDWISSGLLSSKFSTEKEKIVGSATDRINNLRRSISVPSISLLVSKNFAVENNTISASKDDMDLHKSTISTIKSEGDKVLNYSKLLKKKKTKEQKKLKNRCEKFMISHAKKRNIWIHYGNNNFSLVCKKWYIASCHNNVWGIATIMLYLHLSRFSVGFRSYEPSELQHMIGTYYSKPKKTEAKRKKLQVLCDYLLPSKSVFMDTVTHVNNKQFSAEHLSQFSTKLTSEISKRANVVRETMKSIDKKIAGAANTLTEKLEYHISQNKISNTLLGHDIKEDNHDNITKNAEVTLEEVNNGNDEGKDNRDSIRLLDQDELSKASTDKLTGGDATPPDAVDEEDTFEVIPSPTAINEEIIDNHRKRRSKRIAKVNFKTILDDDGMDDNIIEQTSTMLSSQHLTKKRKANNQQLEERSEWLCGFFNRVVVKL